MNYQYINLSQKNNLIDGALIRKLIINKDQSGSLFETMRTDWQDIAGSNFAMQYLSITPAGLIRDEDKWHVHKYQDDRFICAAGRIVTALYDPREGSKTKGNLNLFVMGPQKEEEMYIVLIPKEVYHGFMVISKTEGYLLNFPTQLYNPADEGRVENSQLDWNKVRQDFNINA